VLFINTGGGVLNAASFYPLTFNGAGGTFEVTTDGNGQFLVAMPYGSYQVSDGYAGFGCAMPPVVTPGFISVSSPLQQQSFVTTGCILF